MQTDEHYSEYLLEQQKAKNLASQVREQTANSDLAKLAQGASMTDSAVEKIRPVVEELKNTVDALRKIGKETPGIDTGSLRALAQGELAVGNWLAAATILDEYSIHQPDDFDANFSRGVAYANARAGDKTNIGALRAYNDAIATMPDSLDANYRARLFAYRGAMLKRMHRFEEALADLQIAGSLATNEYEVNDIKYNLASVYALQGDREKMMEIIRQIDRNSRIMNVIRSRLRDYFSQFANDQEFLDLIGAR
jgi:tetratricopeptide (TPR) repeat protein